MPGIQKRKWVVVVLALVAIGVGAYLFSQPRTGTVEYHVRELRQINGRFDDWIQQHAPSAIGDWHAMRKTNRRLFHFDALIRLGYLETRFFSVTNRTSDDICDSLRWVPPPHLTAIWEIGRVFTGGTNQVGVTAPRGEMGQWEKAIRQRDVALEQRCGVHK